MAFFYTLVTISVDCSERTRYESAMTISQTHTFPQISETEPSLVELLATAIAENERLEKLVDELRRENVALKEENLALRERLNRNSTNSNQPPSQDNPFRPPKKEQKKTGSASKGTKESASSPAKRSRPHHKGAQQPLLQADETIPRPPGPCSCGCCDCGKVHTYAVHQCIELVEHPVKVVHYHLQEGRCARCRKKLKGRVPEGCETGYGPGMTALIATLNAGMAVTWRKIADFLHQIFGIPISPGAINKCLRRAAEAIKPHYEAIGRAVRAAPVNHVDETSWPQIGPLGKKRLWLWVMVNRAAALFYLALSRKAEEFEVLRGDWNGTLVSDGYAVYRSHPNERQTCLAHLIRKARSFAESADATFAACGRQGLPELQRLSQMSREKTKLGDWQTFYARFCKWTRSYSELKNSAGTFVRRLDEEFDTLTTFLVIPGVEPTNNLAERTLRHAVVMRKISLGTSSEAGRRWIERALSLLQTCRSQEKSFFEVMRDALHASFNNLAPDLGWIEAIAAKYAPAAPAP